MTRLDDAARTHQHAKAALDTARTELAQAIVEAARTGTKQADIARTSGYTREQIRRICRAAGIQAE
ncbi:hypothetical protein ACN267_31475 [Micromonospora sp. WMMD734]|uniref:hypothetical protein n=1 Tax=unclassified Micromonospora TaxID=2617518 RepID=UPI002490D51D|nr:hypothetical protein [Micromonospora sp. AKA109]